MNFLIDGRTVKRLTDITIPNGNDWDHTRTRVLLT